MAGGPLEVAVNATDIGFYGILVEEPHGDRYFVELINGIKFIYNRVN